MATQDSRIRVKRSTTTGEVPTVAPSNDHTDGTWDALDVYIGEMFLNTADDRLWVRTDNGVREIAAGGLTLKTKKLTIPSAQVLTLNTTPVAFGLTVPTGYYARPLSADMKSTYNTTPYATNDNIYIRRIGGGNDYIFKGIGFLAYNADTFTPLDFGAGGTAILPFATATDLEVYVGSGDPTAGDSDITIYLTYVLIPI